MGYCLIKSNSFLGLLNEQSEDQVLTVLRIPCPLRRIEYDTIFTGHPYSFLLRVMIKRQRAAQQSIDYAAEWPQVTGESVRLLFKDLRRDITKSTKWFSCPLIWSNHLGEAEVDKLWHGTVRCICHHDILELEVTMDDTVIVKVLNAQSQLIGELFDPFFA